MIVNLMKNKSTFIYKSTLRILSQNSSTRIEVSGEISFNQSGHGGTNVPPILALKNYFTLIPSD